MSDFKVAGKMSLDGANFFSTMKAAEGATRKLAGLFAGAFSIGAVTAFSKSVLDLAGKLQDVSSALNINVEFLQKFLNSAAKSGGSLEGIEKFIAESNKSRQAAVNDKSGKEAQAFGRLGFSSKDISSLNPQQFIEKLISAFAGGVTPQKLNDIKEIGGKSAITLANGFADGIDENTKTMSAETVLQLDEIGDKFTELSTTLKSTLAPAILNVIEVLTTMARLAIKAAIFTEGGGRRQAEISVARRRAESAKEQGLSPKVIAKREAELKELEDESLADWKVRKVAEYTLDKEAEDEKLAALRAAKLAAASQSAAAPPEFIEQKDDKAEKIKESKRGITSDSLTSVGNFLGAGKTGSLENIGQRQLTVQQSIAEWVRKSYELANKGGTAIPTL